MVLTKETKTTVLDQLASITYGTSSDLVPASGIDTSAAIQVAAEVVCTYGSAQTVGARLDVYGSLDDTNYSTQPYASYDLTMPATSATVRQVFGIANAPKYLKFKVTNPDAVTSNANLATVSVNVQRQLIS